MAGIPNFLMPSKVLSALGIASNALCIVSETQIWGVEISSPLHRFDGILGKKELGSI